QRKRAPAFAEALLSTEPAGAGRRSVDAGDRAVDQRLVSRAVMTTGNELSGSRRSGRGRFGTDLGDRSALGSSDLVLGHLAATPDQFVRVDLGLRHDLLRLDFRVGEDRFSIAMCGGGLRLDVGAQLLGLGA